MKRYSMADAGERAAGLDAAVAALGDGLLVAIPTETVYGLAADATSGAAVAGIYAAKGRPRFNPLIAHIESAEAAARHGLFNADAGRLAAAFWPGPLTIVAPKRPESPIADLATAGLDTVGLRVPANAVTRELIRRFGRPIAAPSANRSGRVSPTSADDVIAELGDRVAVVLDDGPCPVGVESSIVACLDGAPVWLRAGGVTRERIEALIGPLAAAPAATEADGEPAPLAPGLLASHYAPNARLRLDAIELYPGEALLGFGPLLPPGAERAVALSNLSRTGDLTEAAANLFRALRELDASGAATIAVMPIPATGLGEAIVDRLARAAAPRP